MRTLLIAAVLAALPLRAVVTDSDVAPAIAALKAKIHQAESAARFYEHLGLPGLAIALRMRAEALDEALELIEKLPGVRAVPTTPKPVINK